ncbi:MAG: ParA family protein [Actinomycetales bacterium]|nr:ParA family protein [Actinomycetales bacterium]
MNCQVLCLNQTGGSQVSESTNVAQGSDSLQAHDPVVEQALAAASDHLANVPAARRESTVDFPEPTALSSHGPARVIAVCNQKGGVGKTTTTINLGAALAEYGRKVLLVDFDPQGALGVGLGINPLRLNHTVLSVLLGEASVQEAVISTSVANLDLLPSNIDLSGAEIALTNEISREHTFARSIAPIVPDYDFVLVDCQPTLGLLTVNALTAADSVLIPLQCEYFALRGIGLLTDIVGKVRARLNPRLEIEGIVATMYDNRTLHSREVLERIQEAFGERVLATSIGRAIKFSETTAAGQPITNYASSSAGAASYRRLAREILSRHA